VRDIPDDRGLDNILSVLINRFQNISCVCLHLSLDRQVEVHSNLLRFEVWTQVSDLVMCGVQSLTGVQVVLVGLLIDQDLSLHE
jgi:hypothetical protein